MRNIITLIATIGLALAGAQSVRAHDFWVELDRYWLAPDDASSWARFRIGHSTQEEPWWLVWGRISGLRAYGGGQISDQQDAIEVQSPTNEGGARVRLPSSAGTYVLAMESHHDFIELPAERFTAYARKEGLKAVLDDRATRGRETMPGTELYSRRAKALVQVGTTLSDDVTRPIGHTLEIVPERNPYSLKPDEPLAVRVMFRGRPLAGALIDIRALEPFDAEIAARTTNAEGRAIFSFPKQGVWKLNVIWGVPIEGARADYETIFSSLTFGYPSR